MSKQDDNTTTGQTVRVTGGGPQSARTPRAFLDSDMDAIARAVFTALALHADADGHIPDRFTPTQDELARHSGVKKRQTIAAALVRLQDAGWIRYTSERLRGPGGQWITRANYDLSPAWDREDDARRERNRKRSQVRETDTATVEPGTPDVHGPGPFGGSNHVRQTDPIQTNYSDRSSQKDSAPPSSPLQLVPDAQVLPPRADEQTEDLAERVRAVAFNEFTDRNGYAPDLPERWVREIRGLLKRGVPIVVLLEVARYVWDDAFHAGRFIDWRTLHKPGEWDRIANAVRAKRSKAHEASGRPAQLQAIADEIERRERGEA